MVPEPTSISIAMATYNGERFIAEQLESFAKQDRLPDELVVSDDASSDRTVEIVRDFAARAPFPVRLFANAQNLGVTKNFERAITEAAGEIIFLSDSDDFWYPQKIRMMENALAAAPRAGLAVCNADVVDERLQPSGRTLWDLAAFHPNQRQSEALAGARNWACRVTAGGCCLAMRAMLKPLVLPLPAGAKFARGGHDIFITQTILCSGAAGLVPVPAQLLAYRRHTGQATHVQKQMLRASLLSRLHSCHEPPYLLAPLIDRVGSDTAARYSARPSLRATALRHWRARTELPASVVARLPVVVREALALRYHRFSRGLPTAAKDLFFTRRQGATAGNPASARQ